MERLLLTLLPGISKTICQSRRELISACHARRPVVVAGENSTGKDMVAGIIHRLTLGAEAPFRKIDLSAGPIPEDAELEGNGGATFYLDHCETAGRSVRASLRKLVPRMAPGNRMIVSMIISPLEDGQRPLAPFFIKESCSFISLPPLRKRREDLPLLLGQFCRQNLPEAVLSLAPQDVEYLYAHSWPGNLTELISWLEGRLIFTRTGIRGGAGQGKPSLGRILDREIDSWVDSMMGGASPASGLLRKMCERVEKSLIRDVLARTEGNQVEAAAILGINRNTLAQKIKAHELSARTRRKSIRKAQEED